MKVLVFDPSGNSSQKEGYGTTGYAWFVYGRLLQFGDISSKDSGTTEEYWLEHTKLMEELKPDIVVCESYRLFANKAMSQAWSSLETSQLIGYLRMFCWTNDIGFALQDPKDKVRFNDDVLTALGVFEKNGKRYSCQGKATNLHMRDAIRHGLFYHKYKMGKDAVV